MNLTTSDSSRTTHGQQTTVSSAPLSELSTQAHAERDAELINAFADLQVVDVTHFEAILASMETLRDIPHHLRNLHRRIDDLEDTLRARDATIERLQLKIASQSATPAVSVHGT